jgi:hypothetical protein
MEGVQQIMIELEQLLTDEQLDLARAVCRKLQDEILNASIENDKLKNTLAEQDNVVLGLAANVLHRHYMWRRWPNQFPEQYAVSAIDLDP